MKIQEIFSLYKIQIFITFLFFIFSLYFFQNIIYGIVTAIITGVLFFLFEVNSESEVKKNRNIKEVEYETIKFSTLTKITKE